MASFKSIASCCIISVLSISTLGACTSTKENELTKITLEKTISTENTKVIVLPVMNPGNSSFNEPMLDTNFTNIWISNIGAENTIPLPYKAVESIPHALEALAFISKDMDKPTSSPLSIKGTIAEEFVKEMSEKYGQVALAFSVLSTNKDGFNSSKSLTANMGLFDLKTFTWKWVTQKSYTQGIIPQPYEAVVQQTASASIDDLKKENNGKIN